MDATDVLGLLAEEDRLRVVAALVLGAESLDEVVAATGGNVKTTVKALTRLEDGGLVDALPGNRYRLRADVLKDVARASAPVSTADDFGGVDRETDRVLRAFLRDGRLTRIPAARSKRLVVLDHISRVFEPGVRYAEREVDAMVRAFHPDHAALRRYLVDEGFLSREAGVYWRSGGHVDL